MSGVPKRHHYVPRRYLAKFTDPETPSGQEAYVHTFNVRTGEIRRRSPRNLAVRNHYYSFMPEDGAELETGLEGALGEVEFAGFNVLDQLAIGDISPADLTDEDRRHAALCIALMARRVPRSRDHVESQTAEVMKRMAKFAAGHPEAFANTVNEARRKEGKPPAEPEEIERARQFLRSEDYALEIDPAYSLRMMLKLATDVAPMLFRTRWRILEAPEGSQFLTSDAPFVMVTTDRDVPRFYGVGLATPGMEAIFPLSPTKLLLMSLHHPEGTEVISPERVAEANRRILTHADQLGFAASNRDMGSFNGLRSGDWIPLTDAVGPLPLEEPDDGGEPEAES